MFRKGEVVDKGIRGFFERHRTLLGYVYVTVLFALSLALIQVRYNDAIHKQCISAQENRETLRAVIIISTSSQSQLDLTHVPGFDALDPATQQFFRNLSPVPTEDPPPLDSNGIPQPDPNNKLQTDLLKQVPPLECT